MRIVIVIVVVLAVVALIALVVPRMRRQNDAVDSFRRQIDALSPEARRPVIDQVQNASRAEAQDDGSGDQPDDQPGDQPGEDGVRGT